ncbi:DNA-binding protein [Pseudomonas sp. NPDC098747]|uniref:DNA-binding protein n=1 Tax=Pseudomonas sp. NPDC098747 TaxID=3364487 RepID=UPI00383BCCF0
MAHEGINKQLVQHAKTTLLAQGKRPTIDAVRIALGNTGSKTTISRYLKELEEKPRAALERLSEPLSQLVLVLSERLQVEAEEQLAKAQAQFSLEKIQLQENLQSVETLIVEKQRDLEKLKTRLSQQTSELSLAQESIQELTSLLQEQYTKITTLNNEKQHACNTFEEFRQAREQTYNTVLQQHAQQIAHFTEEQRYHTDLLKSAQRDLVEFHHENARLLRKLQRTSQLTNGVKETPTTNT